jgi:SAM-dependent methyltransferase
MGAAALPTIIDAFDRSRRRHAIAPRRIADVGCGTGRFLRYLARTGAALTGVDRSASMLRLARRNTNGVDVTLLRQDIRALRLPEPVDCITCTFDTVNYLLDPVDLARALRACAENLVLGGWLLFDYIPRAPASDASPARQLVRWGRFDSAWLIRLAPDGSGSEVAVFIRERRRDGGVRHVVERHRQRWHAPQEVAAALRDAGLASIECRPMEPDGNGQWLHVVAQRVAESPRPAP